MRNDGEDVTIVSTTGIVTWESGQNIWTGLFTVAIVIVVVAVVNGATTATFDRIVVVIVPLEFQR